MAERIGQATEQKRGKLMARKASGQVLPPKGKQRSWALRFTAYGKRRFVTLGRNGWNRQRAEAELENVLADVRRGIWQPHKPAPVDAPADAQTFHKFASEWLEARRAELRPRTIEDYEWALSYHLLPYFKAHTLDAISVADVDAFKAAKLREGKLGAAQINKVLKLLAQIMDMAIEYELTDRANPARGRRRRVKVPKPDRTWVEPEQLLALLSAADSFHRPVLATLAGAGLRAGEALALDWRDVNLATGTLTAGRAKTDAGSYREVDMPSGLIEALSEWKTVSPCTGPNDPVFVTRSGRRQSVTNIDHRIKTAIKAANHKLTELGIEAISERVSPHSLRRTYASIRAAAGDSPVYIAEQIGHTDFGFTFRVYQRAVKRRDKLDGAYLTAFDGALEWAEIGRIDGTNVLSFEEARRARGSETALDSRNLHDAGR
jgi:integrase